MSSRLNEIIIFITAIALIIGGIILLVSIFFVDPSSAKDRVLVLLLGGYGCLSVGIFQLIAVIVSVKKRKKKVQ